MIDANEQWRPDFTFKVGNLPAERRMRDVESFRCTPNTELLGNSDEVAEVTQFH